MSKKSGLSAYGSFSLQVAIGVLWFVWSVKGFWWGVLYAIGWETWIGYRIAAYLFK